MAALLLKYQNDINAVDNFGNTATAGTLLRKVINV